MKKNRSIIAGLVLIGLAFGLGLTWRWVQETPYYSLYQIGASLKNRDTTTLLTYVDLASILNKQVSGSLSSLLSPLGPSESLKKIIGQLGDLTIQLTPDVNKGLTNIISKRIRDYLDNSQNPTLPSSFMLLTLAEVKAKEDFALVTLKYAKEQLRLGMKKQDGFWRVVELNPEDLRKLLTTYLFKQPQ
jgi:hypothetical protein